VSDVEKINYLKKALQDIVRTPVAPSESNGAVAAMRIIARTALSTLESNE
jgi:hypothetical protein